MRDNGLRVTLARRLVANVLASADEAHLTAEEIYSRVARLADGVDRTGVQRTLDALEEIGLLHHVHIGRGPGYYHLSDDHHHIHLVCESCARTDVIPLGPFLSTISEAIHPKGYEVSAFRLAVVGRCGDCLSKQTDEANAARDAAALAR